MPIYLQSENFIGDVTSAGFEEHVELLSTNFDVSLTYENSGSNSRPHAANMGKFIITKLIDNASPSFLKSSIEAINIGSVKIKYVRSGSEKNKQFMGYELNNCLIDSYSISTETGNEPVETIALTYRKITFKYTGFNVGGQRLGQQVVSHDLRNVRK